MSWIKTKPIPDETKPRHLTNEEIELIISGLPPVRGATDVSREHARNNIVLKLRRELIKIELSPLAFEQFQKSIYKDFVKCQIEAETPIGIMTADNLGKPVTQSTLNTFHSAGTSKNALGGIEAMKAILETNSNLKNECATIYFKNRSMSYIETLQKRRELIGLTIADILEEPFYKIAAYSDFEKFWWHDAYLATTGKKIHPTTYMMRIYIDKNKVFQHRATWNRIVKSFHDHDNISRQVSIIHGPLADGIIDIIPNRAVLEESMSNNATKKKLGKGYLHNVELIFLENVLRPVFDQIVIQGIRGIHSIYPTAKSIWGAVQSVELISDNPANPINRWFLFLNKNYVRSNGITNEEIIRLLQMVGITVIEINNDPVAPFISVLSKDKPGEVVEKAVNERMEKDREKIMKQRKENQRMDPPLSDPLIIAAFVYTVDTSGCNLNKILSHYDVDENRSYCNNIHHMHEELGILASRAIYNREFSNIASTAGSVNPRYIDLLSAFVYGLGRPKGVSFTGIYRQNIGTLAMATFQQPLKVISRAAEVGTTDNMVDTSSRLMVGLKPDLGTGGFDVMMNEAYREKVDKIFLEGTKYTVNDVWESFRASEVAASEKEEVKEVILPDKVPVIPLDKTSQLAKGTMYIEGKINNSPQLKSLRMVRGKPLLSITPIYYGSKALDLLFLPLVTVVSYQVGPIPLRPIEYTERFTIQKVVEIKLDIIRLSKNRKVLQVLPVM